MNDDVETIISIFGVAIMDGLLSVSYFNALRARGAPMREAIANLRKVLPDVEIHSR